LWAQFNEKVVTPAGLRTDIRIHDLRHTFGFTLREKGVALETISALMRHRRLEDTLIYAKPTRREGATAIKKLEGYAC
jgi:site-specific recombinase XerD